MDEKYLDLQTGLPALWAKIKTLVASEITASINAAITAVLNTEV